MVNFKDFALMALRWLDVAIQPFFCWATKAARWVMSRKSTFESDDRCGRKKL